MRTLPLFILSVLAESLTLTAGLFKTVCYPDVGCFYTGPPFFQLPQRLIIRPPLPPKLIGTTFLLFTRKNKRNPVVFPPDEFESIFKSHFNPMAWTRVIIHGYLDGSYSMSWMLNLKEEFLRSADDNVIVVDSSSLSLLLLRRIPVTQTATDTRVIGVQVAHFLAFLHKKLGVDLRKVHIVGHSFGAEIAGYAGARLPNLGRITALDPAGLLFRYTDRKVQIDDTDAIFVDVIHTNAAPINLLGVGTDEDVGHINFWPGGGNPRGCLLPVVRNAFSGIFPNEIISNTLLCKHQKSFDMFIHSFNQSNCLFVGVECTSWDDFLQGKCNCGATGERCSFMGVFATPQPPPRRRYYLQVALDVPFCLHQYQIIVYLETTSNISRSLTTSIHLTAFGEHHLLQEELSLNLDLSAPKQINTFLTYSYQPVGRIHTVEVSALEDNKETTIVMEAIEIHHLYPVARNISDVRYCRPSSKLEEMSRKNIVFLASNCISSQNKEF